MTRRVDLPTDEDVANRIGEMTSETGLPPAVITVARDLQLSNATFWRHFPRIAQSLADARRAHRRTTAVSEPEGDLDPAQESSSVSPPAVSQRVSRLQSDLDAAAREIQRLTLENEALRAYLQDATSVLPLRPRDT